MQVWLALTNLVVDPNFRAKYNLNNFRKETLNRVRRFLNDLLIDQLPVLKDLQRVVDEVALNYRPNFDAYEDGALVIEQARDLCVFCQDATREQHKRVTAVHICLMGTTFHRTFRTPV